jgi:hypothetical protein
MARERFLRYLYFAVAFFVFTSALNYLLFDVSLSKELAETLIATTAVILVEQWRVFRSSPRK